MPENYLDIFKNLFEKIKKTFFTKDFLIFLVFVLISTAFWFMNISEKKREFNMDFKVEYTGIPDHIFLIEKLPEEISIRIKDLGSNIFNYSLQKKKTLKINLSSYLIKDTLLFFPKENLKNLIKKQIDANTAIVSLPEGILVKCKKQGKKLLTVKVGGKIPLSEEQILSDEIIISPQTVTAYGPENILDTMKFAYTEPLNCSKIESSKTFDLELKTIENIRFNKNQIKVSIPIELTTEKKIKLPIQGKNFPAHITLHTFPTLIEATFTLGISKFNKITEDDFAVFLDYDELKNNPTGKAEVRIFSTSPFIKNLRNYPHEVEFLLEENLSLP